jgi:hypothetical protein
MSGEAAPRLITIQDGYARFAPAGLVTPKEFVAALKQVMVECQAHGQTKLLVDTRSLTHAPLSTGDRYDLSDGLASFWDRAILLSMVVRKDQEDARHFGQLVARNRGLLIGLYQEEAPAIRWLSNRMSAPAQTPPKA